MARTDRPKAAPSSKQLAWRKEFGRRYGSRMHELVKRDQEESDGPDRRQS